MNKEDFMNVLARSEEMIQKLADTCMYNTKMYDKHLCSLEASRDKAQNNAAGEIEINKSLIGIIEQLRADFKERHDFLMREITRLTDENQRLSDALIRMTERGNGSNASVNVQI